MKTRVLIVDDSIFFRRFLTDKLSAFPSIEIVGYATNALEAKYAIPRIKPDVVTLDVEMPGMSGIELLRLIMSDFPVPVVLVSAVNMNVFDALSAGAVDFVKKPDADVPGAPQRFIQELADKIAIAKNAHLRSPGRLAAQTVQAQVPQSAIIGMRSKSVLIAIGASTGGTEATLVVLKGLPKNTPGIVVVQHMPPGFTKMYADRLNGICPMEVREAKDGDRVQQGLCLIAPGDLQMQVVHSGTYYAVKCFKGEKVSGHCPSVDVMFHSVAETAGRNSVGIIMTGMGKDGAEGLLHMRKNGAFTIGQDEESCVVYGMPMVAFNIGAVAKQAPCEGISQVLKAHLNRL
ncbi:MAG: chemotaxis response regulator protein-glutamate methylesterase [Clostridiales bacterium]|nr:chemotaxis response regulator protein-glutamate methylesterase [Clostridiales bacterium]